MTRTFSCPNCAAPLDYDGGTDYTITCKHCKSSVIVPAELRTEMPSAFTLTNLPDIVGQSQNLAEMARLVRAGKKIEAIKMYRQIFGVGLKEAKDAIEALARGEPIQLSNMTMSAPTTIDLRTPANKRKINWLIVALIIFFFGPMILSFVFAPCALLFGFLSAESNVSVQTSIAATVTRTPSPTSTPLPTPTPGFATNVALFGGSGTGPGLFTDARALALDRNTGNLFAADYTGGRVQAFDANGKFLTLGLLDARAPLFALAADRQGRLYVSQGGAIFRLDSATMKPTGQLEYAEGNRFGHITTPSSGGVLAMWYEQREGVITSIQGHRDDLVQFDADGKVVRVIRGFLSNQTGNAELDTKIAVDGLGNIYALGGTFNRAVYVFAPDGKFINKFGSRGNLPGQFGSPTAIAVDNQSRVYVADLNGILVFANDGRYLDTIKASSGVSAMVFNDQNDLFVVARSQVLKFVLNR